MTDPDTTHTLSDQQLLEAQPNPLPREIAPGVFWLGGCYGIKLDLGYIHSYLSAFLVAGDDCSILVDTGPTAYFDVLETQLEGLFAKGVPELRYMFPTHWEPQHSGACALVLEKYPNALLCGDLTDTHLMYPWYTDRTVEVGVWSSLDLGGTEFVVLPAVVRDAISTRWGFDTRSKALFTADGFAYTHYHESGHCGSTSEEAAPTLDIPFMTALFADGSLYWTRFTDIERFITELDEMTDELGVEVVCPTHGLPITDLKGTSPLIREGLRAGITRSGGRLADRASS
jgi:flavorubredoxin